MFDHFGRPAQPVHQTFQHNPSPGNNASAQNTGLTWLQSPYPPLGYQINNPESYTIEKYSRGVYKDDPYVPRDIVKPPGSNNQAVSGIGSRVQSLDPSSVNHGQAKQPVDVVTNYDSGYGGSCPTGTLASPSLDRDDRSFTTPVARNSVTGQKSYIGTTVASKAGQVSETPEQRQSITCNTCNESIKCPSEFKYDRPPMTQNISKSETQLADSKATSKHRARHEKPHKCSFPGCKSNGFANLNDLQRHTNSRHFNDIPNRDDVTRYGCIHCNEAPNKKNRRAHRPTARKDNFRTHLSKVHGIQTDRSDNLERYIVSHQADTTSSRQVPPGSLAANQDHVLQGIGTGLNPIVVPIPDSDMTHLTVQEQSQYAERQFDKICHEFSGKHNGPQDVDNAMRMVPLDRGSISYHGSEHAGSQYIWPGVLNQELGNYTGQSSSSQQEIANLQSRLVDPCVSLESFDQTQARNVPFCDPNELQTAAVEGSNHYNASEAPDLILQNFLNLESYDESVEPQPGPCTFDTETHENSAQDQNGELVQDPPTEVFENNASDSTEEMDGDENNTEDAKSGNSVNCTECPKRFKRPSDLKKHMKRHEKPWRCTFRDCGGAFGSKNDWARHEKDQHLQVDSWSCDEKGCEKTYSRNAAFKIHLQRDHKILDPEELRAKLEKCKTFRACGPHFWCGFCQARIHVCKRHSWNERFDHIDNHFFGSKGLPLKKISEWTYHEVQGRDSRTAALDGDLAHSSKTVLGKRTRNDGDGCDDSRATKLKSQSSSQVWICCNCSQSFMNVKTTPCCVNCYHTRCVDNCKLENVVARDHEDDEESGHKGREG